MMTTHDPTVRPVALRTADESGQVSTAFPAPGLSWRLAAERRDVRQIAYEIQLAGDPGFADVVASSGKTNAITPIAAPWPGAPLESRQCIWCRVRVWTDRGLTAWSDPLRIEAPLFEQADWVARPISPAGNVGVTKPAPPPILRRSFDCSKPVRQARLYVTALGVHDIWLNDAPVGDALFDPGWTVYPERLLYAVHDVTGMLADGENVLAAAVGDGWWRGNLTWLMRRAVYGDTTALLAQLEIDYADGSRETISSDGAWRGSTGAVRRADFYNGCEISLGREPRGWRKAGFDDRNWSPVITLPLPAGLTQRSAPPVRVVQRFPVTPRLLGPGRSAIDCGQNLTGYLRLAGRSSGRATITVRHAEVLEADGALHTAALRNARATDVYHLTGGGFDITPSFTYHGFRYAEIVTSGDVEFSQVEACVVSSDLREIGHFSCSDERLNRLDANIRWSQRGNFIAIPTDCPQRDERLGWTGDIQVFGPTACANFASGAFLGSWLADLALEQAADGQVPSTVPNVIEGHPYEYGGIGWADAATLLPLTLYEAYGDRTVLARQFASMQAWVDWGVSRLDAEDVWRGDFHLGDWLDPGAPPDKPEQATTDRDFIASAYLAFSAGAVARAAAALNDAQRFGRYDAIRACVAAATWRRWCKTALTTQTGCAIAIAFGIVPAEDLARAGIALAALVDAADGRIATGFLGTPLVLPALTMTGQHEAAYRLLLNERAPGWLYQVRNGATTMWERWDAILPDGTINSGAMAVDDSASMISFNHYAYGAVGAWLYRSLAGISPDEREPGYGMIRFQPQPGGGISRAEARIETPYGMASIAWHISGRRLALAIEIPPGAHGTLIVPEGWAAPEGTRADIGSGTHHFLLEAL